LPTPDVSLYETFVIGAASLYRVAVKEL